MKIIPAKEALANFWARTRARDPAVFDRLMAHTIRGGNRDCWPNTYVGASRKEPYGGIKINGKRRRCSRVMYSLAYGDIPAGMSVCHKCDNPACVNPFHLFLGTHHENMLDRMMKNRGGNRKGERNGRAKLAASDVIAIRSSRETLTTLAQRYSVTKTLIANIRKRKIWKHIT